MAPFIGNVNVRSLGLTLLILLCGFFLFRNVKGQQVPKTPLAVMTYNIGTLTGARVALNRFAEVIKSKGVPDLLLLQEVPEKKAAYDLAKSLGLEYCLFSTYKSGKYGLVVISRFVLDSPEVLYLNGYAAFAATMQIEGHPFLVCSVHLERIRPITITKKSAELPWKRAFNFLITEIFQENPRSRAVDKLLSWLEKRQSDNVIIGGDFNTVPFSKAIRKMERTYNDALWPSLNYLTGSYSKLSLPIEPRIDFIFHSPNLKCKTASVIKKSPGDHYPVRAEFVHRLPR